MPKALATLRALAKRAGSTNVADNAADAANMLAASLAFLGFEKLVAEATKDADQFHAGRREEIEKAIRDDAAKQMGIDVSEVSSLIAARLDARKARNFAESDRIRDELAAMGIELKDGKNKDTGEIETTWDVKR
jgi:cysteinyl-tRNA synthetase